MSYVRQAHKALVARILDGDGKASHTQRRAAFHEPGFAEPLGTVIEKVAKHAHKVIEEITTTRASGLREDQIFELVVCAAVGQATRQYDAALAALAATVEEE